MLARLFIRTAIISVIILIAAVSLDYLVNVVLLPNAGEYTPLSTLFITLVVAPPFTFYLISQRARVERTLHALAEERVARETAERSSAAKSQFLAVMSHELRTPLNAVIGYSELMREGAVKDGRDGDISDHDRVIAAAAALLSLINQVLDYSELEGERTHVDIGDVDIRKLAQDAIESVRLAAEGRGNRVVLKIADDVGDARTDGRKLRRCVNNLLANAVKFTRGGAVGLRVRRQGDRLVFDVTDTGVGIPADKLDSVFQPFVQADSSVTRAHGGIGLGLAIVRRFARLLGGEVTATSTVGKGSSFRLEIAASLNVAPPHLRRVA